MLRLGIASCAIAALALADGFTFTIGSPVAAQDFRAKVAAFVFRTEGCADPAKAQISGTAEGLVKGARRSVALKVAAMSKPGVYAVYQTWPPEGEWVVSLKGTCAARKCRRDCSHRPERLHPRILEVLSASGHRRGDRNVS